ncbi:MAG: cbb3-type cytochrome c oxidase subunit I [Nitrospinae bacterium]|nr:cbb3-type cytochrome c oxidase subunit I [Nitrospinota bacterium]
MNADTLAFRTCPTTGLKVHRPAEVLIQINAVTAIVFLLVGGIMGLFMALTRWQTVHLLNEEWFYRLLTLHGIAMLVAWIIFFEMAILYFASAILLNSRLAAPWAGWVQYVLMLVGGAIVTVEVLMGRADVMFTSYVPLAASHWYYLGIILFAVGAIVGCVVFFATLMVAKHEKTYEGSVPLVTFGAAAAAIIAIITLAHGAITFVPTWLWALGLIPMMDAEVYRLLFWGFGHSSQQINVCAMVSVWYLLGTLTTGSKPINEKVSRSAFALYILFICIASEHHLLVDPGLSAAHKTWNTGYFMHLAVLASMIHAYSVPAAVEVALRKKGYTKGLFEWLKKAPWGDPAFSSLALSLVGFGFLGGISGVVYGTEQLNIISHNTLRIPGHFHATVVAGTTLAFMGVTYYVLPLIFRREVAFKGIAKWQPYVYGLSLYAFCTAMMFAGGFGVSRRQWDMTGVDAPFQVNFGPVVDLTMAVVGISGVLCVVGGAMYVLVAVGTLLVGKKINA